MITYRIALRDLGAPRGSVVKIRFTGLVREGRPAVADVAVQVMGEAVERGLDLAWEYVDTVEVISHELIMVSVEPVEPVAQAESSKTDVERAN